MREFIESKRGFLYYENACNRFGKVYIDSLVEKNLVHLRPTKQFSYDLILQEDGVPVITPETPCGLIAMKKILELN